MEINSVATKSSHPNTIIRLSSDVLDVARVMHDLADETSGATYLFVGRTRRDTLADGRQVAHLEYEAYDSMAHRVIGDICAQARDRWPNLRRIVVEHRLGVVPVLETSIVVGVTAAHRGDALQAVDWCVEQLKRTVPIWKKQVYTDDTHDWIGLPLCQD